MERCPCQLKDMIPPNVPQLEMNNRATVPAVGLGCWMGLPGGGDRVFDMCEKALKIGYRHFDTATAYGNEKMVGKAIKQSGVPRNEIFITTKLANADHHRVREAFEESLRELDCDYIDLYLLHWPQGIKPGTVSSLPDDHPTFIETYQEMEKLLETGKVRSIGVSNFSIKTLTALLSRCTVIPTMNQVEMHPCWPQRELKEFCTSKGIILTAYSPLGRSRTLLEHNLVTSIANKHAITPAQVLLSWGLQQGVAVIPKSENEQRLAANITPFQLPDNDIEVLDALHKEPGMHRSLLTYHNLEGTVFGWTYEQLGWNMVPKGIIVA
ncbi:NADP-dependent oxidoreductase domain-containing protein [Cyathus striatus]|nr:NADP-dependent oxidoreductase domain-containing protein [Cyathus striatus]